MHKYGKKIHTCSYTSTYLNATKSLNFFEQFKNIYGKCLVSKEMLLFCTSFGMSGMLMSLW